MIKRTNQNRGDTPVIILCIVGFVLVVFFVLGVGAYFIIKGRNRAMVAEKQAIMAAKEAKAAQINALKQADVAKKAAEMSRLSSEKQRQLAEYSTKETIITAHALAKKDLRIKELEAENKRLKEKLAKKSLNQK